MRYTQGTMFFTDSNNLYEGYLDEHGYSHMDVKNSSIFRKINEWNANVTGKFNTEDIHLVQTT